MSSQSNKNTKIYTELLIFHNNSKNNKNKTNDDKYFNNNKNEMVFKNSELSYLNIHFQLLYGAINKSNNNS